MSHKISVDITDIINSFKALSAQIGPDFSYHDARRHGKIWGAHLSRKTGLTFNEMKKLAGLPVRVRRECQQYIPKYEQKAKKATGEKKPCLGILPNESYCTMMVKSPARLCERCRERNKNI